MANESNVKKRPDYLSDDHLSTGTKEYLKVLNSGTTPVDLYRQKKHVRCLRMHSHL